MAKVKNKMFISVLQDDTVYHPSGQNNYEPVTGSIEEAIAKYAGVKTILLRWKDEKGNDRHMNILSKNDEDILTERLAAKIFGKLIKQLGK